jgi:ribosomal protein L11 methylase PrmA
VTAERVPGSYKDPAGFVFRRDGILYRHVAGSYGDHYDALMTSGLYEELAAARLIVSHREVTVSGPLTEGAHRILQPELVPFVSYPYEWCFGQLRDAALVTLDAQRRALHRGLSLKDATAYNVQFVGGRPILIDTLSFERYAPGTPWVAYRQFCQHFLAPLALMASRGAGLSDLQRIHLDGIPLDLASAHLPVATWARPSLLLHLHAHARSIRHFGRAHPKSSADPSGAHRAGRVSLTALLGLIESLEGAVRSLRWRGRDSEWGKYDQEHSYSGAGTADKERAVREWLTHLSPDRVWDLGANAGRFSDVAAAVAQLVVSIDADANAVEVNYRRQREGGGGRVLPLRMDLTNPSPRQGWAHAERASLADRGPADAVLALALVHHLAISANVPLRDVAAFFGTLGAHLIIEFVPKTDPQTRRLLAGRADVFPDYTRDRFEAAFRPVYDQIDCRPVADSDRVIYLLRRR